MKKLWGVSMFTDPRGMQVRAPGTCLVPEFHAGRGGGGGVRQEEAAPCAPHEEKRSRHAGPAGAHARGHSPLALAGVQGELLAAPGADRQLVLGAVEDIQEQVALPGTAWGRQRRVQSLATAGEESDFAFASSPKISHCWKVSETRLIKNAKCPWT